MSILEGSVTGSVAGSLQLNGEGGTDNYNELINKPQINGVTLTGNKDSSDLNIISDVQVNDVSCVDPDNIARITIPPAPEVPVQDVTVNGTSCMVGTTAEITIPPAPNVPVQDVQVNSQSVVVGGVAEINIPPTPTIPVTDVEVNNASVVSGTVAEINIPVLDVKVDGSSVVDSNGDANITLPNVPVQDVEVDGASVVDSDGVAQITLPNVPVQDVEVDGASVVDADGIAQITLPVIPTIPVTDVEVNGTSVVDLDRIANIVLRANAVSYDNSVSGYSESQTQDAIDEAASNISDNASDISDLQTNVGDFSTPLDTTAQDCHDAINELKGTLSDKNNIIYSGNIDDVEITHEVYTELKRVPVDVGTYLVYAYHQWTTNTTSKYQDYIGSSNNVIRNLTCDNGGGFGASFVVDMTSAGNLIYATYLFGSTNNTTRGTIMSVIKLT